MGASLDLDDLVADWPEAKAELAELRAEVLQLRDAPQDARELADGIGKIMLRGIRDSDSDYVGAYGEAVDSVIIALSAYRARLLDEAAEREPPRVCGNCKHGEPTSLDPMRCYKATPYIPTGIRCKACQDWEPCYTRDNPRAAIQEAAHE